MAYAEWYQGIGSPKALVLIEEWDGNVNMVEVEASGAFRRPAVSG